MKAIYKPLPVHTLGLQQTASGYDYKLVTPYLVDYKGRKRRVYCTCYSNCGTTWIVVNYQRVVVDLDTSDL